jgi:hypothetical protein
MLIAAAETHFGVTFQITGRELAHHARTVGRHASTGELATAAATASVTSSRSRNIGKCNQTHSSSAL